MGPVHDLTWDVWCVSCSWRSNDHTSRVQKNRAFSKWLLSGRGLNVKALDLTYENGMVASVWATNSAVLLLRVALTIKSCSTCLKSTEWMHIHNYVIWLFTLLKEHHFHSSEFRLCTNLKSRSEYHTLKAWVFSRCGKPLTATITWHYWID